MRLIIKDMLKNSRGIDTPEILDLEKRNSVLKEMLKLMRERGVLTFDEMHLAMASNKELNMPFGKFERIVESEARLISKQMQMSATVKKDGKLLLNLCENHQSQQTEAEYGAMVKLVANKLVHDPWMQEKLMLINSDLTPEDLNEVEQYILGEIKDIPNFVNAKVNAMLVMINEYPTSGLDAIFKQTQAAASLIVLAKQLLAGKWLKERLNKSVAEHHGFSSHDEGPRVAIPFIANTKAAEGSEFSDQYVMITNTLMSYAVQVRYSTV